MSKRPHPESVEPHDRPPKQLELELGAHRAVSSTPTPSDPVLLLYPSTVPSQSFRPILFQQPTCLTTFSYTPQRVLEFNDSALRYYVDPPPGADLRYGYERWIKRPEERTRLDGLLRAVERVKQDMDKKMGPGSGKKWLHDIAVVTWRGIITKIMTAPYDEWDSCMLNAMVVDGTLYVEEHLTDTRLAEKENLAPQQRLRTYYGYSFESWCTSSRLGVPEQLEGHPAGWGGDVDTNVQWCSVIKTKIGDDRIVIGGEVDCVRGRFDGHTDRLVELKTSMSIRNAQDAARFEKKLLKFYLQSFLLGVPEIIVGFRTPAGRLTTTQKFKTVELPRLVRGKPGAWDAQICLRFGRYLLSALRTTLSQEASSSNNGSEGKPPSVWRVLMNPKEGVRFFPLDDDGIKEVQGGEDRIGFLPTWYFNNADEAQTSDVSPPSPRDDSGQPESGSSHHGWNI